MKDVGNSQPFMAGLNSSQFLSGIVFFHGSNYNLSHATNAGL